MKKNELMIDDWVIADGVPSQILSLGREGAIITGGFDKACHYDNMQPIPITPEILEKNGFSKPVDAGDGTLICGMSIPPYKLTFQSIFGLPVLTIEDVVDDDNLHTCLVLKDEIYSVHKLQHTLKSCEIEKEIVL